MSELCITVMPGDHRGPEIMAATLPIVERVAEIGGLDVKFVPQDISIVSFEATGEHMPDSVIATARATDAVLKGPVGGPPNSRQPRDKNIEAEAVIGFRKRLGLHVNERGVDTGLSLIIPEISPLKAEFISDTDLVVVRDLSGDVYNGPSGVEGTGSSKVYFERNDYTREQVDRTLDAAIETAQRRGDKKITLIHKKNAQPTTGGLWLRRLSAKAFEGDYDFSVEYRHFDDAVQALIGESDNFGTIVTPNLIGDVISDATAKLMGSIGMGGAAEIGEQVSVFGPIHGSAPFLEPGTANPSGMILAVGMMFERLGLTDLAKLPKQALGRVLDAGFVTQDLYDRAMRVRTISFEPKLVGTQKFAELVLGELDKAAA